METLPSELFKTIRRIQIQTTHLAEDILAGAYRSAFKGKGIEFEEVREYLPGDEIRSIDWNVTARMDRPFVKIFREERELNVMLMIDISASCRFGQTEKKKSELIAEIGALLAFSAIKNNDKIGLVLFSDKIEKFIPPKKGLRHVLRIIREVLYCQPTSQKTDLAQALAFTGKLQQRATVCFVISDFFSSPFDHEWKLLAKKNDLIAMKVGDPYERQFPQTGLVAMQDLETGTKRIMDTNDPNVQTALALHAEKVRQAIKTLSEQTRTGFVEFSTDTSPLIPIQQFFRTRSRQWRQ